VQRLGAITGLRDLKPFQFEHHAQASAEWFLVVNEEYPLAATHNVFGAQIVPNPTRLGATGLAWFEAC